MKITIIALAIALSGCMTAEQIEERDAARRAAQAAYDASHPRCEGEQQCNTMWELAQVWVSQNTTMRISLANNVRIETYPALNGEIAASVTKIPEGNGRYKFVAKVYSGNVLICGGRCLDKKRDDFNAYITRDTGITGAEKNA